MSWDIAIERPTGKQTHYCDKCSHTHESDGREIVFDVNYTSNMWPMLRKAEFDWDSIEGKTAAEALPVISDLMAKMEADPAGYRMHNPVNGWGDFDTFYKEVILSLKRACLATPDGIIHISQ